MQRASAFAVTLCCSFVVFVTGQDVVLPTGVPKYVIRKCCTTDQYYNLQSQQCVRLASNQDNNFKDLVRSRLVKGRVNKLTVVSGRLSMCPDTGHCFETVAITNERTHTLLTNGIIFENFFGVMYDLRNYCVETVGTSSHNLTLAIAFCLPETNVLSKCCPENHFFDARTFKCVPYPKNDTSENLLSTFFYFKDRVFLKYQYDLECATAFPIRHGLLSGAYIDRCNNICLGSRRECYSLRKFCLDSAFTGRLEPSVYVCADNVTKVCCKDEFYEENEIKCGCGPIQMS